MHSEETKKKIGDALRKPIYFKCDYCGKESYDKLSQYVRKIRHFCSRKCYSLYRKERMVFTEQNTYKGVRKSGESKQVYHRNYCENHPENIAHLKARRYARERGATGSHTIEEWEALKDSYGNLCASCGKKIKLTKDHIIPLSKGGTDYIENIQPLCRNCNSRKHNHIHESPELLKGANT